MTGSHTPIPQMSFSTEQLTGGPFAQVPPWQVPASVQGSMSSHWAPSLPGVSTHLSCEMSQLAMWQASLGAQYVGVPVHTPLLQLSFWVQNLPSSQAASSLAGPFTQAPFTQVPVLHWSANAAHSAEVVQAPEAPPAPELLDEPPLPEAEASVVSVPLAQARGTTATAATRLNKDKCWIEAGLRIPEHLLSKAAYPTAARGPADRKRAPRTEEEETMKRTALFQGLRRGAVAGLFALVACSGGTEPPKDPPLPADPPQPTTTSAGQGAATDDISVAEGLINKEKFDEAKAHLEKTVQSHPSAKAHFYLGVVREKTNDKKGAEESYKEAIKLDPKFVDASSNLAALYLDDKRPAEAVAVLKAAAAKVPGDPLLARSLAFAYSANGDVAN